MEEAAKKSTDLSLLYTEYLAKDEITDLSKKDEIASFYKNMTTYSDNLNKIQVTIQEFETSLFNKDNGLQKRLSDFQNTINNQEAIRELRFKTLFEKIENLLPGATTAGLAETYVKQTNKYTWPYYIWAAVFIITLGIMAAFGVSILKNIQDAKTITEAFIHLIGRAPVLIPLIWIAIFASKQQSQNKRLEQEYAHKANVAKTYEGHKRQIENMPDGETKDKLDIELLKALVDNVKNNPSNTLKDLSHNDSPPILSSFFSKNNVEKPEEENQK